MMTLTRLKTVAGIAAPFGAPAAASALLSCCCAHWSPNAPSAAAACRRQCWLVASVALLLACLWCSWRALCLLLRASFAPNGCHVLLLLPLLYLLHARLLIAGSMKPIAQANLSFLTLRKDRHCQAAKPSRLRRPSMHLNTSKAVLWSIYVEVDGSCLVDTWWQVTSARVSEG